VPLVTRKEERVVREVRDAAELLRAKEWSTWLAGDGESMVAAVERHCSLRRGKTQMRTAREVFDDEVVWGSRRRRARSCFGVWVDRSSREAGGPRELDSGGVLARQLVRQDKEGVVEGGRESWQPGIDDVEYRATAWATAVGAGRWRPCNTLLRAHGREKGGIGWVEKVADGWSPPF
jgi:hypothetical protein